MFGFCDRRDYLARLIVEARRASRLQFDDDLRHDFRMVFDRSGMGKLCSLTLICGLKGMSIHNLLSYFAGYLEEYGVANALHTYFPGFFSPAQVSSVFEAGIIWCKVC